MRTSILLAIALLFPALTPAAAFDCGKAATPVEKAICANPALKSLDDRLEVAYAETKSASSASEQKMLAMAQKAWIASREAGCPTAPQGIESCVMQSTDERLSLFEGRQESGPGAEGRIIPVFVVQEGSETQYNLDITMLRFSEPKTAGEKAFNAVSEAIAARVKIGDHGEDTAGHVYALEEGMTLSYASPRFISVRHSFWSDLGGAHGNGGTLNTNIDMQTGKVLEIGDLFPESAVISLMGKCRAQLMEQKKTKLSGEDYDPAKDGSMSDDVIAEHIATLAAWQFTEREASVSFDPYVIGSYAEGDYECTFPMTDLRPLFLSGAPLP